MDSAAAEFIDRVCAIFGLGDRQDVLPLQRSSNLVWDVRTATGRVVVKELPVERFVDLRSAAQFERAAFDAAAVPMAEPRVGADGALIHRMNGSRGQPVCVRVHRYMSGRPVVRPVSPALARPAGRLHGRLHDFGTSVAQRVVLLVRIWRGSDANLLADFCATWSVGPTVRRRSAWR